MKKILLTISIFYSLILFTFVLVSSTNLNVTCQVGGPYLKNSRITFAGNVTNITGTASNITIYFKKGNTVLASLNTTSASDGKFITSITPNLDSGNYTINATAERFGVFGNCTGNIEIKFSTSTSCVNKTITVNGTSVYADTGQLVSTGTVYLSILDNNIKSSASISDGQFSVSVSPCLNLGQRYTVVLTTTGGEENSWSQILFVYT